MEATSPLNFSLYGAKGLCDSPEDIFISRPRSIFPLLLTASKLPDLHATRFLHDFINLLHKSPLNIASLVSTQDHKGNNIFSFVLETVLTLFQAVRSGEVAKTVHETWIKLLELLLLYYTPSRCHYDILYEKLGKLMAGCRLTGSTMRCFEEIYLVVEIIEKMVSVPQVLKDEPRAYFWFLPSTCCLSAVIPKNTVWPFNKGYTILMWIKVAAASLKSNAFPVLFRIRNNINGFECFLANNSMNYRVVSSSYTKPSK